LDQQFLRRRSCTECQAELFPREVYCAHCGHLNRKPEEVLLLPPDASPRRQFGSLFLDLLTVGVLVFVILWSWTPLFSLVLMPVFGLAYRVLGRTGGRQTFGQAVFSTVTVTPRAGPVTVDTALRRTVWETLKSPLLLLGKAGVVKELEGRTGALEISLV
jgi:hypothetical protein